MKSFLIEIKWNLALIAPFGTSENLIIALRTGIADRVATGQAIVARLERHPLDPRSLATAEIAPEHGISLTSTATGPAPPLRRWGPGPGSGLGFQAWPAPSRSAP